MESPRRGAPGALVVVDGAANLAALVGGGGGDGVVDEDGVTSERPWIS